ncbi:Hpt domain-containing protein [Flavobacteriaceae bacterium AU392]|nr:Hpt domain-containing protein [Flavobacteriaceae bacterium]RKM85915.1 Hpt domain-containing protein [Flavobacteriaceae bacterium AU392]
MEQPNLYYINDLSSGDAAFKNKIIAVIKSEFPEEKSIYLKNIKSKDYKKAAENVHKLKHKISILGLEKSYALAVEFENDLRDDNLDLKDDFNTVLQIITDYLNIL